jgi:hypothetical protein
MVSPSRAVLNGGKKDRHLCSYFKDGPDIGYGPSQKDGMTMGKIALLNRGNH